MKFQFLDNFEFKRPDKRIKSTKIYFFHFKRSYFNYLRKTKYKKGKE